MRRKISLGVRYNLYQLTQQGLKFVESFDSLQDAKIARMDLQFHRAIVNSIITKETVLC